MNHTLFKKAIKNLLISLPCMFLGPMVIYSAFTNRRHPLYIPVLLIGISICIFAAYIGFRGIQKMVKSL